MQCNAQFQQYADASVQSKAELEFYPITTAVKLNITLLN